MNKVQYQALANNFTYAELCFLEDAVNAYKPDYNLNVPLVTELKETITAARGWVHHLHKTDREKIKHNQ